MLGYALRKLRDERDIKQESVAMDLNVTPSAVSRWESSGSIPEKQVAAAAAAVGVSVKELRKAVARSLPGRAVQSEEMLSAWRNAVALSPLPGDAKLVLIAMALPHFLDYDAWFTEVRAHELADAIQLERDRVYEVWESATASGFVEGIGSGGQLFRLKFPDG